MVISIKQTQWLNDILKQEISNRTQPTNIMEIYRYDYLKFQLNSINYWI